MFSFFTKNIRFKDLPYRTDVHSHILPGVDDGFRDIESSRTAVSMLGEMGLTRFVLTPHIFPELYPANTPDGIRERFASVLPQFDGSGAEFRIAGEHMVHEAFEDAFVSGADGALVLPGNQILIEMSYAFISRNLKSSIFYLNSIGLKPVLAHPERYVFYSRNLLEIRTLVEMECRMQLNLLSLGGHYGKTAKEKAELMLENGLYTYAGTDLHGISQIAMLENLEIPKRLVPAVEKLIEANDSLF